MNTLPTPLLVLPSDNASHRYEILGYIDAYDAVLNCDHAFLAYKETDPDGKWRVRIKSSQTAGALFDPALMQVKARECTAQGIPWFAWGYSFEPSAGDPRLIQFRVHVADGQPDEIEMIVRLRKYGGTADLAKSVRFSWPSE